MKIADLERDISKLHALIAALQQEPRSLKEEIFQKYVEFESTPKVAKYLREKGIRTERNTSFQAGDVSEIIKNDREDIDPVLVQVAQEIFKKNTRAVARLYW